MNEDLDSMAKRFREVRDSIKTATGRPSVTFKDTLSLMRENIAGKMYSWTHARVHKQEASQSQTPHVLATQQQGGPPQAQGGGRPTILGSLMGRFQQQEAPQQQAPQMSPEEIEYQRSQQVAYQRAREKALNEQKRLATAKKRKGLSLG